MFLSNMYKTGTALAADVKGDVYVEKMDKNNPTACILWGSPGAGKSTLTNFFGGDTIFKNTDDNNLSLFMSS